MLYAGCYCRYDQHGLGVANSVMTLSSDSPKAHLPLHFSVLSAENCGVSFAYFLTGSIRESVCVACFCSPTSFGM